jgi:hypothetical protein
MYKPYAVISQIHISTGIIKSPATPPSMALPSRRTEILFKAKETAELTKGAASFAIPDIGELHP